MAATETAPVHEPNALDYETLMLRAGLFDRSERGKLALSGPQSAEFLDSLLSNDIAAIGVGQGCEATLLTHKGRLLSAVRVLRTETDWFWLDTERAALQALFDALHNFRIGYDTRLHKRTLETALFSLIGPLAAEVAGTDVAESEHANVALQLAGAELRAVRTDVGIDLFCASGVAPAVNAELIARGASVVGEAAIECVRIETGRPRFGVDIDETTMPQEAELHERAVSFKKGCYIGQETVARLYWKGKPNRHLRLLALSAPAFPGTTLRQEEHVVGTLGSVAVSPRQGPLALALVRREAAVGDRLALGDGGTATILPLPGA